MTPPTLNDTELRKIFAEEVQKINRVNPSWIEASIDGESSYEGVHELAAGAITAMARIRDAARVSVLEECAQIADNTFNQVKLGDGEYGGGKMNAARTIAANIRAMKEKP